MDVRKAGGYAEEKDFYRDDGQVYRAQELQLTQELVEDDRALATIVRMHLEQYGAVIVRVVAS